MSLGPGIPAPLHRQRQRLLNAAGCQMVHTVRCRPGLVGYTTSTGWKRQLHNGRNRIIADHKCALQPETGISARASIHFLSLPECC